MTAATLAHLPLQVGGVALASTGRGALWVIQRFMRAPLTNSAIGALVITTALAGSNALFGQRHAHPAPLFAPAQVTKPVETQLVVPAPRPKKFGLVQPATVEAAPAALTPPAEIVEAESGPIGNKDVFEVQRKLEMMKLFSGTIDGYYGPQTANAIRKFEELNGLEVTGKLTADIAERIKAAPLALAEPQEQSVPETRPAVTLPIVKAAPVEAELPPAAAMEMAEKQAPQSLAAATRVKPLSSELNTGSIGNTRKPVGRAVPDSPDEAFELAAKTAGEAIDTIIEGVEQVAMNKPDKFIGPQQQFAPASTPLATTEVAAPISSPEAQKQIAELAATPDEPQVGVPLKLDEEPAKPGQEIAVLDTPATPQEVAPVSVTDPVVVAKVQRGLASLGFLHGPADGVAGEATAKAIRNFEIYFNYETTGRITPELLDLLVENGASI